MSQLEAVKYILWAQDMSRAVAFYRGACQLTPRFESEHWSELRFGDAIIALHGGHDGSRVRTGLSLQFDDIEAACAAVCKAGGQVLDGPIARPQESVALATIVDTEGNEIMLSQHLG